MKIRLLALGLTLAALLGLQGRASASYTYSSTFSPGTVTSLSSSSMEIFDSAFGGPFQVDGTSHLISLSLVDATSSAGSAESLTSTPLTDTLTITDGGMTGTFTITFTPVGTGITGGGGGTYLLSNVSYSPTIYVNDDTYTLSNLTFTAPTTNGSPGLIQADLVATPGIVPEPSSLVLIGLGGAVALLGARRFKTRV